MITRLLMITTTVYLTVSGLVLSFLPQEFLNYFDQESHLFSQTILQVIGALYLGFAMLNWMMKSSRIGGIYNRPVVVANLMHFGVVAITLMKLVVGGVGHPGVIIMAAVYGVFTVVFAYLMKSSPV
ncbi:hypothetical protein [Marinoscillum sp.]|uniref:hypothetical protein n=1 Tax=Marinoscillum sp. TaxID=2024838 RepID=UPI003BAD8E47